MGFLSRLVGKKVATTRAAAVKIQNKDLVEAAVGGAVLVAFADGELEDAELATLNSVVEAHPAFAEWRSEVGGLIDRYVKLMKAGRAIGKLNIMREIGDVQADQKDREDVFAVMVAVAQGDGEVEPEELKLLKEIGAKLSLRAEDFLEA